MKIIVVGRIHNVTVTGTGRKNISLTFHW